MNHVNIDYQALEEEVLHLISQKHTWSLATAVKDHVTARTVYTVNIGLKIYFQTDVSFTKYKQITINPHVALCQDNIQIEGLAKELGHPLAAKNKLFSDLFKRHHPVSFNRYSVLPTETIIEINPLQIAIWEYSEDKAHRDFLMLVARTAYREEYRSQEHV